MRIFLHRRALLAGAALVALAAAGLAIAGPGPASTSQVSASFYANTLVKSHAQTCTGTNNDSYQVTDATFTGTAASTDTHLAGPLTIHVRSIYDATTNLGSLTADVHVGSPPPPGPPPAPPAQTFHGHLTAVNVNGTVQGYLTGHENGGGDVQGNLTATFSATGGFSSSTTPGQFGAGSGADSAIVTSGGCKPTPPAGKPDKPDHPDQGNGPKGPKGPKGHH
jgi:hypothetical protein